MTQMHLQRPCSHYISRNNPNLHQQVFLPRRFFPLLRLPPHQRCPPGGATLYHLLMLMAMLILLLMLTPIRLGRMSPLLNAHHSLSSSTTTPQNSTAKLYPHSLLWG